jgi:hypothetical protein
LSVNTFLIQPSPDNPNFGNPKIRLIRNQNEDIFKINKIKEKVIKWSYIFKSYRIHLNLINNIVLIGNMLKTKLLAWKNLFLSKSVSIQRLRSATILTRCRPMLLRQNQSTGLEYYTADLNHWPITTDMAVDWVIYRPREMPLEYLV